MNCRSVEEKLLDEGTSVQEAELLAHLHECSGCRGLYEDLAGLEKMNRSLRRGVKAPPDFYRKIAGSSMSGGDLGRLLLGSVASMMLFVIGGALIPADSANVSGGGEGGDMESRRLESQRDPGAGPGEKTFIVGSRTINRHPPPISNSAWKTLPAHRFWCGSPAPSRCAPATCITGSTGSESATSRSVLALIAWSPFSPPRRVSWIVGKPRRCHEAPRWRRSSFWRCSAR